MRLINVQTRKIKDFIGTRIPQYAILSHTWEEGEEVTYQDYIAKSRTAAKGYRKVDMTCRLAIQHGLSYAWVDTCCIDKTSSAELSEAINSMFRWYQNAQACFVYLNDLEPDCWDHLGQCRWYVSRRTSRSANDHNADAFQVHSWLDFARTHCPSTYVLPGFELAPERNGQYKSEPGLDSKRDYEHRRPLARWQPSFELI